MNQAPIPIPASRPLSDTQMTLFWFGVLVVALNLGGVGLGLLFREIYPDEPIAGTLADMSPAFIVQVLSMSGFILILLHPGGPPRALWLRAFRSDRDTVRLRRRLEAALGPDCRLVGIRPPSKRTSLLWQAVGGHFVGLSYAGSPYFEMEAGDDWLRRLAVSMRDMRLVLIDLRTWTDAIGHEVGLAARAMGPDRCVLLIDASRSPEEWKALADRHGDGISLEGALFLRVDEPDAATAPAALRRFASRLPAECPGQRPAAEVHARAHCGSATPWQRFFDRLPARLGLYFAGLVLVNGLVAVAVVVELVQSGGFAPAVASAMDWVVYGIAGGIFLRALSRVVRKAWLMSRYWGPHWAAWNRAAIAGILLAALILSGWFVDQEERRAAAAFDEQGADP